MPSATGSAPVDAFLAALGSGSPVPGGGAAAALSGALAAALVGMVCRVTAERDPSGMGEVGPFAIRADQLRLRLARLVDEDIDAYRGVREARASGPATVEIALRRATEVPLRLARSSREVLTLCETVAPRARRSTVSDLGVAAALAWGALESGVLTARTNLGELTDAEFVRVSASELEELLADGEQLRRQASETIARRMERLD